MYGMERRFDRYIGIDYSGAETPESSCKEVEQFWTASFHGTVDNASISLLRGRGL
jgi:hypothetical protein